MSRREEEVLANIAARRRGTRGTARGGANQEAPATQADVAGVCQVVSQLLQQQEEIRAALPQRAPTPEFHFERFKKMNPPIFSGGPNPLQAESWIRGLESLFESLQYPDDVKVRMAVPLLIDSAEYWWRAKRAARGGDLNQMTWEEFKDIFYEQYFPESVQLMKENEFLALQQADDMTVLEYANQFNELSRFCPQIIAAERSRANRFEQGLRYAIRSRLSSQMFYNYQDLFERALKVEAELKRSEKERGDRKRSRQAVNSQDPPRNPKPNTFNKKKGPVICSYCLKPHTGLCYRKTGACFNCGEVGHQTKDCPKRRGNSSRITCYACGEVGHRATECPKGKNVGSGSAGTTDQRQTGNARVFALTRQEASANDRVVSGTLMIDSVEARVLFDSGASHSFISTIFAASLHVIPEKLVEPLYVTTPLKTITVADIIYRNCIIWIGEK